MVTAFGETRCVAEWSELLGVNRYTIYSRLDKGWSDENALRTPTLKLSDIEAEEIRCAYAAGNVLQRTLARRYGIHQTEVSRIVRRLTKHVTEALKAKGARR